MQWQLLPVLDTMLNLYRMPRTRERFDAYLQLVQGDTSGDMALPVAGFNPMAKDHIIEKLTVLKELQAEAVLEEVLNAINQETTINNLKGKSDPLLLPNNRNKPEAWELPAQTIQVALNLSDDLLGGWTNRFTSDYDSKFRISGLVSRQFCTPIVFTSEVITKEIIRIRTREYVYRTIYWMTNGKPRSLKDHVMQECFVAQKAGTTRLDQKETSAYHEMDTFYKEHVSSEHYPLIFNFFYGDEASASLGYPTYGISEDMNGYEYARHGTIKEA